jgi:threonine dehydrogenase-like Zn-dependent dehydrogenase
VRAVRVTDAGVQVVDRPRPTGGESVRVAAVGICGSDLHLAGQGVPVTLGHEIAGHTAEGDPVAVHPLQACGTCPACQRGLAQLCERAAEVIVGVGLDGGMADWVATPATTLLPLPEGLDVRNGCLVEPTAVSVHGCRRAGLQAGERVCIIGGGPIGLTAAVAAQHIGADVTVVARRRHQQDAADALGAQVSTGAASADAGTFDLVVDAAGTTEALRRGTQLSRSGGRVLVLATYWDPVVELDTAPLVRREVSIVPARMYDALGPGSDFSAAAELLAARPGIATVLISHRFPLSEAAAAFALIADRSRPNLKVVLEP